MAAILDSQAYRLTATTRKETESPRDPRCKLAFQRICGTCKHFQGDLKPARIGHDVAAIDSAECAYFGTEKHRRAKAWKCHRWERRGAANV